ncbi:TIGR00255 family protein [Aliiroseovarius halocynthiae]|uniref:YicC family protein n=1 Tax=Aliiroseovarius halocynthiae TaxID=985055 RepID=A0A545SW22_9RHOB|nr:YicC/YloC family endoribonuclease [Aliiroseovarius halocynthiae]TQV69163.1 YicC family protein [Aliiroseovarius halocynthiae]SMR71923.1 TIGR00255 family protein [Aliiroseovarius halocynthiae]
MIYSMTGYASATGELNGFTWVWDMRSVNARGLDIRLRLPDGLDGVEDALRKSLKHKIARGNVSVTLRVSHPEDEGQYAVNPERLGQAVTHLMSIAAEAEMRGLVVSPVSAADIAQLRGVIEMRAADADSRAPLIEALRKQIPMLIDAFVASRQEEGQALAKIMTGQVDQVETLVGQAEALLNDRSQAQADGLRAALARIMDATEGADPDRVSQELALIAVKTDVREELDRLKAHVSVARAHLTAGDPAGRKLDFLMQEFNREANTLCSKAQFNELTRVGLDLKHVIDQMREQVQNVE